LYELLTLHKLSMQLRKCFNSSSDSMYNNCTARSRDGKVVRVVSWHIVENNDTNSTTSAFVASTSDLRIMTESFICTILSTVVHGVSQYDIGSKSSNRRSGTISQRGSASAWIHDQQADFRKRPNSNVDPISMLRLSDMQMCCQLV